ncbi:MAG TPA: 50S ribosomal protein L4 [Cytophagaceae bacterium]|jgi:large subunit ribosomal protein L4|nr:50S ribosomal protein L4 [Cytophagaceae bacterium]
MELSVLNIKGKETGRKITLSESVFGIEPNDHAIYLDIKRYMANQRQGTHKSKERAEVDFSTRKLKKQKGTGGARAGSRKAPVFVGGGTIFGPRPRTYDIKINKKVRDLARKSAFAYKAKESVVSVIDNLDLKSPKTQDFVEIVSNLSKSNLKTLFILPEINTNAILSSRNLKRSKVVTVGDINTYDLLNADRLILVEGSLSKIEELLNQ